MCAFVVWLDVSTLVEFSRNKSIDARSNIKCPKVSIIENENRDEFDELIKNQQQQQQTEMYIMKIIIVSPLIGAIKIDRHSFQMKFPFGVRQQGDE